MMKKQAALSAAHCQVLQQPFYQFAQMKQFAPESIEGVKVMPVAKNHTLFAG